MRATVDLKRRARASPTRVRVAAETRTRRCRTRALVPSKRPRLLDVQYT